MSNITNDVIDKNDKKHRYGTLKRLLRISQPEFGRIVTGINFKYVLNNEINVIL